MRKILISLLIALPILLLVLFFAGRYNSSPDRPIWAVGLRGTTKVSRPLSKTQQERLDQHFLSSPPRAHGATGPAHSLIPKVLNEVQTIQEFNERQKK